MRIGVIKEIKDSESRVALTPKGVKHLIQAGHEIVIEFDAGKNSGFSNQAYQQAGATLVRTSLAWAVDLVLKVKEPQVSEYQYLDGQILFTFLHLAGVTKRLTDVLLEKKVTSIAYELVEDENGELPILAPMSAIAGNIAALMGSYYLAKHHHGKGMQLGRVLNKQYGKVLVIGDGIVGQHAAQVANAMGAKVFLAGIDNQKLEQLSQRKALLGIKTFISSQDAIAKYLEDIDLVIGAVLSRGSKATKVITEDMVQLMRQGSVIVDVSIDQGGCIETSKPTTHTEPVFIKHGVVHYCVANMPGAYPETATMALTEAALPYISIIAKKGLKAVFEQAGLKKALSTYQGHLTCEQVAIDLKMTKEYKSINP